MSLGKWHSVGSNKPSPPLVIEPPHVKPPMSSSDVPDSLKAVLGERGALAQMLAHGIPHKSWSTTFGAPKPSPSSKKSSRRPILSSSSPGLYSHASHMGHFPFTDPQRDVMSSILHGEGLGTSTAHGGGVVLRRRRRRPSPLASPSPRSAPRGMGGAVQSVPWKQSCMQRRVGWQLPRLLLLPPGRPPWVGLPPPLPMPPSPQLQGEPGG